MLRSLQLQKKLPQPRYSTPRKQKGITAISVVALLAVFAFFVMVALAIVPIYMENFKVNSHLNKMKEESALATMSDSDIVDTLFRRFAIDDVENIKPEDVTIVRNGPTTDISVGYVVYAPFIANVEIVVTFNDKVTIEH